MERTIAIILCINMKIFQYPIATTALNINLWINLISKILIYWVKKWVQWHRETKWHWILSYYIVTSHKLIKNINKSQTLPENLEIKFNNKTGYNKNLRMNKRIWPFQRKAMQYLQKSNFKKIGFKYITNILNKEW